MKIDEIFEHIGNFGTYHKILYVVVFLAGIPNAFIVLHTVYTHAEPPFHCALPEELLNLTRNNLTEYETLYNYSIPMENDAAGNLVRSQCRMYDRNYSAVKFIPSTWPDAINNDTKIVDCKFGYSFQMDETANTAVVEYSMVCGNKWMSPLIASLLQAGMALGAFTGTLADRYGRRTVFLSACVLQVVFTMFCALSWDYYSYAVGSFLVGCVQLVNYVASFVLASEVIAIEWRNFIVISQFYSFALGFCIEPLVGYLVRDWRHFLWAVSALSAVFYLPSIWLFPESARWLLIKGRKEEGIEELKRMAKMNKCDFDVEEFVKNNMLEEELKRELGSSTIRETLRVIFRSGLTARFLSCFGLWFVSGLVYYGISLYSNDFSEDPYINLLCSGLAEFPALFAVYFVIKWIGRPRTSFFLMIACGCSCIALPFLNESGITGLTTVIAILGKAAASGIFYAAYFLSAENAPTLQRSSAMSISSFSARIGAFGAPFLMVMGKDLPYVPNFIMGASTVICGLMCIFFIPETKGIPLPDTAKEAAENKRFYRCRLFRSLAPSDKPGPKGRMVEL